MVLLVTGLPSQGKTRFVEALASRVGPGNVVVGSLPGANAGAVLVHVHAESDVEALVEGAWPDRTAAKTAAVVVRVDWEPTEVSVERVLRTLHAQVAGA